MKHLSNIKCFSVTCQGLNPDVRYEVQYSSYVNVTSDGFVILKRAVKTESFALQVTDVTHSLLTNAIFLGVNEKKLIHSLLGHSCERWTRQQGSLEQLRFQFRSFLVRTPLTVNVSVNNF